MSILLCNYHLQTLYFQICKIYIFNIILKKYIYHSVHFQAQKEGHISSKMGMREVHVSGTVAL